MLTKRVRGIGGGGWVSAWGAIHMAAALAGCRMVLVSTGWTNSYPVSTDGYRNHFSPLVYRGIISGTVGSFQSRGAFSGWKALTIESSL